MKKYVVGESSPYGLHLTLHDTREEAIARVKFLIDVYSAPLDWIEEKDWANYIHHASDGIEYRYQITTIKV